MTDGSRLSGSLDWEQAYARLDETRRIVEARGSVAGEAAERVLHARALALAQPPPADAVGAGGQDILVLLIGGERYGVPADAVLEVVPPLEPTPVPCTPPHVLGVVAHRGRILPVIDLPRLIEPGRAGRGEEAAVAVAAIEAGEMTFGLAADSVEGVERMQGALEPLPAEHGSFLQGLARGTVAVLDLEALAADARLVVDEEIRQVASE